MAAASQSPTFVDRNESYGTQYVILKLHTLSVRKCCLPQQYLWKMVVVICHTRCDRKVLRVDGRAGVAEMTSSRQHHNVSSFL